MSDPHRLHRFELAQDEGRTYEAALRELRAGRKASHWMWFVFPQLSGLGQSPTSRIYGISGLAEAQAYVSHPVLGARLLECAQILTELRGRTAREIFGPVDAMKLRSSMTLFALAAPEQRIFADVLAGYFGGDTDKATEHRLGSDASAANLPPAPAGPQRVGRVG